MKLKNICLGIACIAVVSACSDKMDYHEYRLAKLSVIGFRL